MPPLITVHTPTWNRAATLPRAWESIQKQTSGDFEWIVTDDGSDDGTLELLEKWQREASFPMRVFSYGRRVGKPVQDNFAARVARGRYFLTFGSDDTLVPNAIETYANAWRSIPPERENEYCGIVAQSMYFDGTPTAPMFPNAPLDTTNWDRNYRLGLIGDSVICYRTEVLRAHPYPELDFVVPEGVVWELEVGQRYKVRCINDLVVVGARNAPNAISHSGKMRYNRGYSYGTAKKLDHPDVPWKASARVRAALNVGRLAIHGRVGFRETLSWMRSARARTLVALLYPLASGVAVRDRVLGKVDHRPFERPADPPREISPAHKGAVSP